MIRLTEAHIADFFTKACTTLEQNPDSIQSLFPDASFNFIQSKEDSIFEITTESFTLSCLIGDENRCEEAYIFINKEDELEVVMRILHYCRKAYRYSYLLRTWINEEFGIEMRTMDQSILLAITKLGTLPDELQKILDSEFSLDPN